MVANRAALQPRSAQVRRSRVVLVLTTAALLASLVLYIPGAYGHGDVGVYHRYALDFWTGAHRLRALPVEYPALALAPFTLTLLPPLPDYYTVFGMWMLGLFVAGYLAIERAVSTRAAQVAGVYVALGAFATALGRYDLVPAAAVVAVYWAARRRRYELAYGALALGTLLKLYPLVLLPVLVLEHYRTTGAPRPILRGLALFGGAVVGMFALSAMLNPDHWLGAFSFNAHRPIQVESVPASLLWLTGLAGLPTAADRSFNSYNLVGRASGIIGLAADLALVGGCLLVYWRQFERRIAFGRALTLCVLIVICANRVLSPQYLLWVLPLVAVVEQEYDLVWLAICALTTLIFPFAYDWTGLRGRPMPAGYPLFFPALIAARNALLVIATVRFAARAAPVPWGPPGIRRLASESRRR